MKELNLYLIICIILSSTLCGFSQQKKINTSPNIILFVVDDMGWQDTSVPFHTTITKLNRTYHTPNMERLAAKGVKFTQAYATPICSPSRVSLLTGSNAARHKVTNWTLRKNLSQDAVDNQLSFPVWNMNGLSQEPKVENSFYAKALPQILKENGYYTIHAGKAHLGAIGTPGANPLNLGFDVNIAGHAAGAPESYKGTENFGVGKPNKSVWAVPGLEKYHGKDIFLTEAITEEALAAIDHMVNKKPFFLHMSHYAVHVPIMGDPRYLQNYIDAGLNTTEASYASMLEGMDKSLGDIMDFLEKRNIMDNTIILFISDNGGLSAHARGGTPHTHNKPLASGKGSLYEGGIRVPMLVSWPGKYEAGKVVDQYVIIEDFFPSILEITKIENVSKPQIVDGISFKPLLVDEPYKSEDRPIVWHYPNKWGGSGPGIGPGSAIRKGDWKLIYFYKTQDFELYNLAQDIGETENLFYQYPKLAFNLVKSLTQFLKDTDAQLPFYKEDGQRLNYPLETFKDLKF